MVRPEYSIFLRKRGNSKDIFDENKASAPAEQLKSSIKKTSRNMKNIKFAKDKINWVSATAGRNFMLNTPIDDVFNLMFKTDRKSDFTASPGDTNILFEQGNKFEDIIISYLKTEFSNEFISIRPDNKSKFDLSAELDFTFENNTNKKRKTIRIFKPAAGSLTEKTYNAIKEKKGIIYSGVLINPEDKTYGIPDLILSGKIIKKIFPEWTQAFGDAAEIKDKRYYIFDIKYTTLQVKTDSISLRNDRSNKAYKSQIMIYKDALKWMLGDEDILGRFGFLLGRSIKSSSEKINDNFKSLLSKINRPHFNHKSLLSTFISIGRVDPAEFEIKEKSDRSILWIRRMRRNTPTWAKTILSLLNKTNSEKVQEEYSLGYRKLPAPELYPNMSSIYRTGPWIKEKKELATLLGEITMIWRLNYNGRVKAHEKGIYSWRNRRFETDILPEIGAKKDQYFSIQRMMITSSHTKDVKAAGNVEKQNIKYDKNFLSDENKKILSMDNTIDLFVDFEGINTSFLPFEEQDKIDEDKLGKNLITMIGVLDNKGNYKCFTAYKIDRAAELTTLRNFHEYIMKISMSNDKNDNKNRKIRLWHWSAAEPTSWRRYSNFYPELSFSDKILWTDLHKIFIDEKIVIQNVFGFGLKEVTSGLIAAGRIDKKFGYDNSKIVSDGIGAMFTSIKYYKNNDQEILKEIIEYNKIDCVILREILSFLRN